jgi:hypothetical protein
MGIPSFMYPDNDFGGLLMKIFASLLALLICSATYAADQVQPQTQTPDSEPVTSFDDEALKSRLIFGPDRWAQFHALIQAGVSSAKTWDASANETKSDAYWSKDFFIRACKLSFNGQIASNTFFFLQTNDLTAGKSAQTEGEDTNDASGKNKLFTQDAYIKFVPSKAFQMYAGLLTVPRDRQNMQSQATMLTANGQTMIHSSMNGYSNNGRDTGIMFRGLLPTAKPILEYRLGVFRGLGRKTDDVATSTTYGQVLRNKKDLPRITGRIQLSAGETEETYFLSENYLGKRGYLSWGLGVDYQPDQVNNRKDYLSYASDISLESPFSMELPLALTMQGGFIKSVNVPDTVNLPYSSLLDIYGQIGLLINQKVQPTIKFAHRGTNGGEVTKYRIFTFGLNYYINGHFSNIKFDFDLPISKNNKLPDQYKATLQFQGYL